MQVRRAIRLPVGVRDFLPEAASRRRAIVEALLAEFERWGYERVITPAFEYADVLERGLGEDSKAAAIRFVEPATGEVVALRPDITPQIARLAATRFSDIGGPIRLSYEGAVLRLFRGARGQREIIQTGVELIDAPAPNGDGEIIALAAHAMSAAGFPGATMDIGHAALSRAALRGIEDLALGHELRSSIAKKDRESVAQLCAQARLQPKQRRVLESLPELYGEEDDVLPRARRLAPDATSRLALDDLSRALDLARGAASGIRLTVDLGELSGFEYYTGMRLAGYVPGVGDAVLRGGRYDELISRYGRDAQAVGFAIDVEAIAQAEGAPQLARRQLVLLVERGPVRERAFRLAQSLRQAGSRAVVDVAGHSTDREARAYASKIGAGLVLVLEGRNARILSASQHRKVAAEHVAGALAGEPAHLLEEMAKV